MGLPINDAAMMVSIANKLANKGTVVCLGEPLLPYGFDTLLKFCKKIQVDTRGLGAPKGVSGNIQAKDFFAWLGYKSYKAMDISDYEGAEVIHDLNDAALAEEHHNIADLIFDGGTLEHVYHLPNALACIHKMLKTGGVVIHHNPTNGYLDHGFFQISPTFYYDYYRANQYANISGNIINRYKGVLHAEPYLTDIYRNKGMYYGVKRLNRATLFFSAQKTGSSTHDQVPIQTYYNQMHSDFKQAYTNAYPFDYRVSSLREKLFHYFPNTIKAVKRLLGMGKKH